MNRVLQAAFFAVTTITTAVYGDTAPATISDDEILDYATRPYNKFKITQNRIILGSHGKAIVVAEYICSDLCPEYTVRVVHYELKDDQTCSDISGIEKNVRIPVAIAAMDKIFCFPKTLTDNWERYTKMQ